MMSEEKRNGGFDVPPKTVLSCRGISHGDLAETFFRQGKGCCQSILCAFAPQLGLDESTALRIASAFGGGIGRLREVCGVFTGACMVLGLLHGDYDPLNHAEKSAQYARVQAMAASFRLANGSIVCRDLLGLAAGASFPLPEKRTDAYYQRRPCATYVRRGGEILDFYLLNGRFPETEADLSLAFSMGKTVLTKEDTR